MSMRPRSTSVNKDSALTHYWGGWRRPTSAPDDGYEIGSSSDLSVGRALVRSRRRKPEPTSPRRGP